MNRIKTAAAMSLCLVTCLSSVSPIAGQAQDLTKKKQSSKAAQKKAAQEKTDQKKVESVYRNDVLHEWIHPSLQSRATLLNQPGEQNPMTIYWSSNNYLAAPDGKYAAQTKEELQTYLDLGITYQYIESPTVRKVLGLKKDQGIIIEKVSKEGMGIAAGFESGDLVLEVAKKPVDTQYKFVIELTENRGKPTPVRLMRNGKEQRFVVKLAPVEIKEKKRWLIGVSAEEISDVLKSHLKTHGVVVNSVIKETPAMEMGIQVNDVIVKIGDTKTTKIEDLQAAVQKTKGESVTVDLIRSGNKMTMEITPSLAKESPKSVPVVWGAGEEGVFPLIYQNALHGNTLKTVPIQWYSPFTDATKAGSPQTAIEKIDQISSQIESLKSQIESIKKSLDQSEKK